MQPTQTSKKLQISIILPFVFIALFALTSNSMFAVTAGLLLGFRIYKSDESQLVKIIGLVVCVTMAIVGIGYQLGKDAGTRDRSQNSMHTAASWLDHSFKRNAFRSMSHAEV